MFKLIKKDTKTKARLGSIKTTHGYIESPFFMPVGTNGAVKSVTGEDLLKAGAQIMLSNTYHLFLRPGTEVIQNAGGLHKFVHWKKPMLTDSGGYQVFSLAKLRKISDEGVEFQSHIDGSTHFFTPQRVIEIERILGSDIIMPLDECAPYPCERKAAEMSVDRTTLWAQQSKEAFKKLKDQGTEQQLFGIIQGATYQDLRERSTEEILKIGFDGYAIGGVSVGEPVEEMFKALAWVEPHLPEDHPRYFMGIGYPDQIVKAVGEGIDMFDTCIPSRYGRNGAAFTRTGKIIMRNAQYAHDMGPIDETCDCFVCQKYTRSYLRHLLMTREINGLTYLSYHNIYMYIKLMWQIREAIKSNQFESFQREFLNTYQSHVESVPI